MFVYERGGREVGRNDAGHRVIPPAGRNDTHAPSRVNWPAQTTSATATAATVARVAATTPRFLLATRAAINAATSRASPATRAHSQGARLRWERMPTPAAIS